MRVFKFHAKKKKRYFELDDICYIMMHSLVGCSLNISATSTKIRALAEPEKIKEFNKAQTKGEKAQEENNVKKKEQYVKELEEKYDDLLKEYLRTEQEKKDVKKINKKAAAVYDTQKVLAVEMNKHRRELLSTVATLYKKEKEEFNQKYRHFQMHKWEILKSVKQNLLNQKMMVVHKR